MAARDFDDVAALVNDWRANAFPVRHPGCALDPMLRARLHVERGLDAGWITDGLGEQIAADATEYRRSNQ